MDVSFTLNPESGKLTFARSATGDFYLDERGVYPVLATLYAKKGQYLFDSTVGTYLSTILKENRATATRFNSAGSDALEQVAQDLLIRSGTAKAERVRSGYWALPMRWLAPNGDEQRQTLRM